MIEIRISQPFSQVDNYGLLTAWVDGEQAASLSFGHSFKPNHKWELGQLHVLEPYRRQGIGTALIQYFMDNIWMSGDGTILVTTTPDGTRLLDSYTNRKLPGWNQLVYNKSRKLG